MSNCRSLFLVSLRSCLGDILLCLSPLALTGTTNDSAINATENKVTQDTGSPVSKIDILDIEALPTNKSAATLPIKLAGNINTLLDNANFLQYLQLHLHSLIKIEHKK